MTYLSKTAPEQTCQQCGHSTHDHSEYPTKDPRYRPMLFACAECGCTVST